MQTQQYEIHQHHIGVILNWIKTGEIAIPEIQRPFVWTSTKVRDLMDSLYRGYPTGYLIVWTNPSVRLKDGTKSADKKILIDGQQRVTALTAAILGMQIVDSDYKKKRIRIAFHPIDEQFEVRNPAIEKDKTWIPDIAVVFDDKVRQSEIIGKYCQKNPDVDEKILEDNIYTLRQIMNKSIGLIKLESSLDIETVNTIFERVNSSGVQLSQADFAMSKIAVHGEFGANLRKLIDYFAHLAMVPEFYNTLSETDQEFKKTGYLEKLAWLKNENDDLYDPAYSDVLRVAFTCEFDRGKISDLVSLLSGRNFETRDFEAKIQDDTFKRLETSILRYVNEYDFKRFTMIIRAAGFVDSSLITSQNAINAAYILYLKLRQQKMDDGMIEKYVQKWFVMSLLTGRYSSSPETTFDNDAKGMSDFERYFDSIIQSDLSDAFWNVALVRELDKSTRNNPLLNVFIAACIKANEKGFLSKSISVRDLVLQQGDMHHIFPRNFLKKKHLPRKDYNQIANLVYTQTEINIKIKDKPPAEYMSEVRKQCDAGELAYGSITDLQTLETNLEENCIPVGIYDMGFDDYPRFLEERRVLMARKIRNYFKNL